ncbi:MAG: hypothetical protein NVSMB62_08780 [Acidobacteriaceae bacterium]
MTTAATTSGTPLRNAAGQTRGWLSPLNLHIAGVALLAIINIYLLIQLVYLWQKTSSNNADAVAQQQIALKTAEIGAQPLRGLDTKLAQATTDADAFYDHRLPGSDSEVLAELGILTHSHTVRLTRAQYLHAPVLPGTAGELTEMRIDASLSGDYRPLVQFINGLERDRIFFLIDAVTLTGQQSGTVNLRLRLRTYLRGRVPTEDPAPAEDATTGAPAVMVPAANAGGPQ